MSVTVWPNFKRVWRLRFLRGTSALEFSSSDVVPLKFDWSYSQGMGFDPARFEATVFGLTPSQRQTAISKGTIVELYCGYEATGAPLHYRGVVYWGQPVIEGADRGVKVLSVGTANSRTTIRIPRGATNASVLTSLMAAYTSATGLSLVRGPITEPAGTVPRERVLVGPVQALMRQWADEHGLELDQVNGVVQAVAKGSDTGEGLIVVSPDSGLEGAPEQIMAGFGAQVFIPRGCRFSMRIRPDLRIGRRVKIVHEMIPGGAGIYIVRRVTSRGSSIGASWTMSNEATGPV